MLNRCRGLNSYPGFESLPHRQFSAVLLIVFPFGPRLHNVSTNSFVVSAFRRTREVPLRPDRLVLPTTESPRRALPGSGACSVESSTGPCVLRGPGPREPVRRASPDASRTCARLRHRSWVIRATRLRDVPPAWRASRRSARECQHCPDTARVCSAGVDAHSAPIVVSSSAPEATAMTSAVLDQVVFVRKCARLVGPRRVG